MCDDGQHDPTNLEHSQKVANAVRDTIASIVGTANYPRYSSKERTSRLEVGTALERKAGSAQA
jgi:hypothetical protein